MDYYDYLQAREWAERRLEGMERAGANCEHVGCYETDGLQVHHLTYERLGCEDAGDLMVVCDYHHKAYEAQKGNAPVETIDFDEWVLVNFGENWQDELPISEAEAMYKIFLVSEWPLEIE